MVRSRTPKVYLSSGKKYREEDEGLRLYINIFIVMANIIIIVLLVLSELGTIDFGVRGSGQGKNKTLSRALYVLILFSLE